MPFYEYECSACGEQHEALQKISDPVLRKCPACGRQKLRRLMSAPVFRLKGGGWYETDFKSDKEQKRNLAGGEDAPAAASGDTASKTPETSAASKPAASEAKKPAVKAKVKPKARAKAAPKARSTRRR
jgi:putative FmdB family regulatory protein